MFAEESQSTKFKLSYAALLRLSKLPCTTQVLISLARSDSSSKQSQMLFESELVVGKCAVEFGLEIMQNYFETDETLDNRPTWALSSLRACNQSAELDELLHKFVARSANMLTVPELKMICRGFSDRAGGTLIGIVSMMSQRYSSMVVLNMLRFLIKKGKLQFEAVNTIAMSMLQACEDPEVSGRFVFTCISCQPKILSKEAKDLLESAFMGELRV
jgi:hypothetical protein